jgi:hypothetical protein
LPYGVLRTVHNAQCRAYHVDQGLSLAFF